MTCCGGAFLVVAFLAMSLSIASLWVPFVAVFPQVTYDDGSSGFNGGSSSNGGSSTPAPYNSGSNSGVQPSSNSGVQPNSNSGYQPNSNSGYQPNSNSGYQPNSNSGYQPNSNSGYQPNSNSGYQPNSNSGYQPSSNSGYQPNSNSGYQPNSNSGVQPNSNSGYHSSNNGGTGSNSAYHSSNDGGTGSNSAYHSSNDGGTGSVSYDGFNSNTGKKQQRTFKQQSLIPFLSQGTMQCPFFDNHCHVDGVRLTIDGYDVRTNDLVRIAGCDSLGVIGNDIKSRFWAVTAAAMSAMTFLIAICHARKGNNFGNYAGLIKFGAAGIAAAHVGACGAVFLLEAPISSCVVNYLTSVYDELNGTYLIVMLSLMFNYAAAGLNFLNALGMMLSYCVSCCGAPAGRDTRPASSVSSLTYIGIPLMSPFQAQQSYDTYGRLEGGNIQEGAEGAAAPTKEV